MYINVTLFIQVINLFITYWFLKRFFYAPFLASIEKKKEYKTTLQSFLSNEQETLNLLEQKKIDTLVDFQNFVANHYQIEDRQEKVILDIDIQERTPQEVEKMVGLAQQVLVKKVTHGY